MAGEIAIIGAGICGLAAAEALTRAGRKVVVFDKSRGIGGRLATRRTEAGAFDHGAPFVDANDPEFALWLAANGAEVRDGKARGAPGMSGLLRPLARTLDIRGEVELSGIAGGLGAWSLRDRNDGVHGPFAAVLVAIPAPQAMRLLPEAMAPLRAELSGVEMAPVWTVMAALPSRTPAPDRIAGTGPLDCAIRQSTGQAAPDLWVAHMSRDFSRSQLERDKADILPDLVAILQTALGTEAAPDIAMAHRWRFARTAGALGRPCLGDPSSGLLLGGDWALGDLAVHGWQSGRAMAARLMSDA
jgi:predicted NAD/FAD-dependent oxidoreductase